jgi:MoxR-vWA-beta-propeller ternary system domain bpX2
MEKDAGSSVKYYVRLSSQQRDDLSAIRHWTNLKTAVDGNDLWIKDLDYQQVYSKEVRSLSFKNAFYERDNHLYPLNSNLPDRIVPALLWTPIDRSIPVSLPTLNHNFFGITDKISISLIESQQEREAVAMLLPVPIISDYSDKAPAVRMSGLRWCLIGNDSALVIGKPVLPLPGETLWSRGDHLIPTGLDFELHALAESIQVRLNASRDRWLLWNAHGSYTSILKTEVAPLSRSSVRESTKYLAHNTR